MEITEPRNIFCAETPEGFSFESIMSEGPNSAIESGDGGLSAYIFSPALRSMRHRPSSSRSHGPSSMFSMSLPAILPSCNRYISSAMRLSQTWSWLDMIRVVPFSRCILIAASFTSIELFLSMFAVGSSSIKTAGLRISLAARATRWASPPESSNHFLSANFSGARPTLWSSLKTVCRIFLVLPLTLSP